MKYIQKILIVIVLIFGFNKILYSQANELLPDKTNFQGPLKHLPDNFRYFTDDSGKAIFLTGSHTWANFQDIYNSNKVKFDWSDYLNMLTEYGHNFIRLWTWEQASHMTSSDSIVYIEPDLYMRSGIGNANDGESKFDLDKFNPEFFERLSTRVAEAGEKGIYVSVMLFQGWSQNKLSNKYVDPFDYHPFHKNNNINGIEVISSTCDLPDKPTLHSMENPALKFQMAYTKKIIEELNDFDNVLYEIINEGGNTDWLYYMIDYIHTLELSMPKQHMVGLGSRFYPVMSNKELWNSNADWISPCSEPWPYILSGCKVVIDYEKDPPANNYNKVVILDTDHIMGIGGSYSWAWKSFCRGHNPIFMDPWESWWSDKRSSSKKDDRIYYVSDENSKSQRYYPDWEPLRKNLGYIRYYSRKVNLANMYPCGNLSSTKYCIANPGFEYVVFFPEGGAATLNLTDLNGECELEWFIPVNGHIVKDTRKIKGGYYVNVEPPYSGDVVLYIKKI